MSDISGISINGSSRDEEKKTKRRRRSVYTLEI